MSRYILIRETGSTQVTVVDKHNGTAEQVEAEALAFQDGRFGETEANRFKGIESAIAIAEGTDFSARHHYRA